MGELTKLGRYQLKRVLGKGAMGVVYEGFDPVLNRRVAVKTILRSVAIDQETERAYSARFVREAQAVARLNHPNIVQVHDFGEQEEVAYLVMEFIEGRELRSFFGTANAFAPAESVRIMGELLDALDLAHRRGVIHRDVKPANVMLDQEGRVKLTDFGVARVQESERSAVGTMVGTPAFMSPEQISGGKIDRRTDIFSAGTILYQLLTGEQPFKGEGAWTVAKRIMEDDPPRPSSIVAALPRAFDEIVNKALAKNPAERYSSAGEFATALRGVPGASAPAPAIAPEGPKSAAQASETELEFWRSIQNRDDLDEIELYLEQFPEGAYSKLARLKVAKLREPLEVARKASEERARREAEERAKREAADKAEREAAERARREAQERARREAEGRARREAAEKAEREAAERARREAQERARREAAEKAEREAAERARREAQERARREAEERAKREAEEKVATVRVALDEDVTVAISRAPQEVDVPAKKRRSFVVPAAISGVLLLVGGAVAFLLMKREPAPPPVPAPVAQTPATPPSAADGEKIKREADERLRRDSEEKAAAEKAATDKALAEKAAKEKAAAEKAAAEKAATEKALAEKATKEKAAAEKAAAEKAAMENALAEKAAKEKAAAEKAAAERAAAEKAVAEKAAGEKAAAERAAAEKAAAAKAAPSASRLPKVGDWWTYRITDKRYSSIRRQDIVEVRSVSGSTVAEVAHRGIIQPYEWTHAPGAYVVGGTPGAIVFAPHIGAFRPLKAGDHWDNVRHSQVPFCDSNTTCRFSALVKGTERVAVEAGEFQAFRIEIELRWESRESRWGTRLYTLWHSEAVKRMVKMSARGTGGVTIFEPDVDIELIAFELQ